ncbi:NADP-dependent malic enzyme [Haoranjiania flava]|uniref:NADP-dependent malic enzyme n=2 Tax=Haoranjiania flava TaxID=1856322 RepID=A0AAE3IQT2_9BACT|nr:NADP-dependent malic enzyme [Haoranjiania flava]MCU7695466.1 NADP-dependent malic enzyme [Haoranjiania flava]
MEDKEKKNVQLRNAALDYHSDYPAGKIEVVPSKPHGTQRDLSLAYSPGVAEPCMEIYKDAGKAYDYTSKGNLVAVISNGTAVLGLGDIGADASKPVMEGKGLLFKIFADINVFDIEINEKDPDKFIDVVKSIAPTFGGINLEDIKAPEAFYIEKRLKEELPIPLMHDDQHGTAIISAAALLNALEIAGKKIEEAKVVVNGAGAAAVSCSKLYLSLGLKKENLIMCDSKGVINTKRTGLTEEKVFFISNTEADTLEEVISDADVFVGLSKANVLTPDMLKSMSKNPIVFALANPNPEIDYNLAIKTRKDVIMATGRSDFPNQVNNVLGFPYIFRGALDVRATGINEEMKLAAVHALADLSKEPVPEMVLMAYNLKSLNFGKDYFIPKPFDNRLITRVSMAVAKAAMDSGVARKHIEDWEEYELLLLNRMGRDEKLLRAFQNRARLDPKRVVLSNAEEFAVLKAAQILEEEGIAKPVLLGWKEEIKAAMKKYGIELDAPIVDPSDKSQEINRQKYEDYLWKKGSRQGITKYKAKRFVSQRDYFGPLMVEMGDADALLIGYAKSYKSTLKPIETVVDKNKDDQVLAGMVMLLAEGKTPIFLCDTSVNEETTAQNLVDITRMADKAVRSLSVEPRIAMLSIENFYNRAEVSKKVAEAVAILHRDHPEIIVDGEMQADTALDPERLKNYSFSKLTDQPANVLIFPDQVSAKITYKTLRGLKMAQMVGPVLLGLDKPVHVMQMNSSVREIVNLATLAVIDAQSKQ